jgi:hypothetical protein
MGIDILADAIKVHLIGVWPDLKATASIQPMAWFNAAFSAKVKSDPDRYTLDQFW